MVVLQMVQRKPWLRQYYERLHVNIDVSVERFRLNALGKRPAANFGDGCGDRAKSIEKRGNWGRSTIGQRS